VGDAGIERVRRARAPGSTSPRATTMPAASSSGRGWSHEAAARVNDCGAMRRSRARSGASRAILPAQTFV